MSEFINSLKDVANEIFTRKTVEACLVGLIASGTGMVLTGMDLHTGIILAASYTLGTLITRAEIRGEQRRSDTALDLK